MLQLKRNGFWNRGPIPFLVSFFHWKPYSQYLMKVKINGKYINPLWIYLIPNFLDFSKKNFMFLVFCRLFLCVPDLSVRIHQTHKHTNITHTHTILILIYISFVINMLIWIGFGFVLLYFLTHHPHHPIALINHYSHNIRTYIYIDRQIDTHLTYRSPLILSNTFGRSEVECVWSWVFDGW